MAGSGTKEDPWLIAGGAELAGILRNPNQSGYYKLTANCTVNLSGAVSSPGFYRCKVIDAHGYSVSITGVSIGSSQPLIAGVMFLNCYMFLSMNSAGDYLGVLPFYNCFFTDCLVYLVSNSGFQRTYEFCRNFNDFLALEIRAFRRLVIIGGSSSSNTQFDSAPSLFGTSIFDVYKWTSATAGWFVRLPSAPALSVLDGLAGGRFTSAGWFNGIIGGVQMARPFFADVINFVINTLVAGQPASRELMYEAGGQFSVLGVSNNDGLLDLTLRIRRFLTLRIVATESYALDRMQNGNYVEAGKFYLPPVENGRKYQASVGGQLSSLQSVTFGAAPVVVNGITFTPAAVHPEMASIRTTLQTGGPQQFITLDTADMGGGGGGPVIEGDPAYLDGVVEEIHPMTGSLRPLVNAEVAVFERRANVYVSMGAAVSNQVGEFRVETEVYGGGDVLAFALDFPGLVWQPAIELGIGSRIRPTVNNGYVYEIITAGNSGATEPMWWADEGDGTEGSIGGATAKARPYYQPVGHGPLKMTFVE